MTFGVASYVLMYFSHAISNVITTSCIYVNISNIGDFCSYTKEDNNCQWMKKEILIRYMDHMYVPRFTHFYFWLLWWTFSDDENTVWNMRLRLECVSPQENMFTSLHVTGNDSSRDLKVGGHYDLARNKILRQHASRRDLLVITSSRMRDINIDLILSP